MIERWIFFVIFVVFSLFFSLSPTLSFCLGILFLKLQRSAKKRRQPVTKCDKVVASCHRFFLLTVLF